MDTNLAFLLEELKTRSGVIWGNYAGNPNANQTPASTNAPVRISWLIDESTNPPSMWLKKSDGVWASIGTDIASSIAAANQILSATQQVLDDAEAARDATYSAAQSSGVYIYDTKALATAAVGGLANLSIVEVLADESQSGARTRYRKESGSLVFKISMDDAARIRFLATGVGAVPRTLMQEVAALGVSVEQYGAVGDGTTDDGPALRKAITAAGTNGTLRFTPGKTYLVSGRLSPLAGQTWVGYGACLKRINSVSSATATAITTGTSPISVTVASSTGFSVGMDVTVFNGSSYDPNPHVITSIVGNVVSIGTNFTVAFPSGGTLVSVSSIIYGGADDVTILGLEVNGNRANNTALAKWEIFNAIRLSSARGMIRDCYVHDEVSEGMYVGGDGITVTDCKVIDCGGNGIHFSAAAGLKAVGNFVKNCNILGTAPGHADGMIIFSNATEYAHIIGNYMDTGICGVGSIDSADNSSVVIQGNIIRNCTTYAIEGILPSVLGGKCVISDNLIYDSIELSITNTGSFSAALGPYNCIVADNFLQNTIIKIVKGVGLSVSGNHINIAADVARYGIQIADVQGAIVSGNTIVGGLHGIELSGSNSARVSIAGNSLLNQYARGISVANAHSGVAVSIDDNTVSVLSSYTTNGSYYGVVLQNNTVCRNNTLDVQTTSTQSGILCPNGGVSANGAIVTGNVVRSAGLTYAIRAAGGSQNNWIVGNYTQQTVSNGGGASNTVAGNYTIY